MSDAEFDPLRAADQHRWQDAVALDPGLPDGALRVARCLFAHQGQDGRIFPSGETIAAILSISDRSAWRFLMALVGRGFLVLVRRGGGARSNEYALALPPGSRTILERGRELAECPQTSMSAKSGTHAKTDRTGTHAGLCLPNRVSKSASSVIGTPIEPIKGGGRGSTPSPRPRIPGGVGVRDDGIGIAPEALPSRPGFQSFLEAYPPPRSGSWNRPAIDAARVAFEAAVAGGTDAATILAGVGRYAETVEPRFLSTPAKWIARKGWEDRRVASSTEPQDDGEEEPTIGYVERPVIPEGLDRRLAEALRENLDAHERDLAKGYLDEETLWRARAETAAQIQDHLSREKRHAGR